MGVLVLLWASLYQLEAPVPPPPEALRPRVERALAEIRAVDRDNVGRAVRDLALMGKAALGPVLRRLNRAEAGERLLLLTAVSKVPEAAPLLAQARRDPSSVIRAWVAPPPPFRPPPLETLARRYLELLPLAEPQRSRQLQKDFETVRDAGRLGRTQKTPYRKRMDDETFAKRVRDKRTQAARKFADAAAWSLRRGKLKPDLQDPLFVAFLALLREEKGPRYTAAEALVAVGEPVAPLLEELLPREQHDAQVILRILFAVRKDRGQGLYSEWERWRPEVQSTLLLLAPEYVEPKTAVRMANACALSSHSAVRFEALRLLLSRPPPAGRDAGRALMDPSRQGLTHGDLQKAATLVARTGKDEDVRFLLELASYAIPEDGSPRAARLRQLQSVARMAVRSYTGPLREELARTWIDSSSAPWRSQAVRWVQDRASLEERLRTTEDSVFARSLIARLFERFGAEAAPAAIAAVERFRTLREKSVSGFEGLQSATLGHLRRGGFADALVAWLRRVDTTSDLRNPILEALARFERLDRKHEAYLLGLYDNAAGEDEKKRALAALLPLATDAVRDRFRAAETKLALDALHQRALDFEDRPLPLVLALERFVEGADRERLEVLRVVADGMDTVEPGLFLKMYEAMDKVAPEDREDATLQLLHALGNSKDVTSADAFFQRVLDGEEKRPGRIIKILRAAARLLKPARLAELIPLIRKAVEAYRPLPDGREPETDVYSRSILLFGLRALAVAGVPEALDELCNLVLAPDLRDQAYARATDGSRGTNVSGFALEVMRLYPEQSVRPAFERALRRSEASGGLAHHDPEQLSERIRQCYHPKRPPRRLYEVGELLLGVLRRLPWHGDSWLIELPGLVGRQRYKEAGARCRASDARRRALGLPDDWGSPFRNRLLVRAAIFEARAQRDPAALKSAWKKAAESAYLSGLAARLGPGSNLDRAATTLWAETSVRLSAGLRLYYRQGLARARLAEGRPQEALLLLDTEQRLPHEQPEDFGMLHLTEAQARVALGQTEQAAHALDRGLRLERWLKPWAEAQPEFKPFKKVFAELDTEFFDQLFRD